VLTLEALLMDIDERAGYMPIDTQVRETAPRDKRKTRRGWLTAAVAFGVVLLFGAMTILMISQRGDADPAEEVTVTTEALTAEQQASVDTAYAAIASYNAGDVNAWVNSFREASTFTGRQISSSYVKDLLGFRIALGEQIEVVQCVPDANGSVTCDLTSTDAISDVNRAPSEFAWTIESEDGRLLGVTESGHSGWRADVTAIGSWVEDARPEVWLSALGGADGCRPPGGSPGGGYFGALNCMGHLGHTWSATPVAAETLLGLVDEYKAQLDN
jgi:hypothetical protein